MLRHVVWAVHGRHALGATFSPDRTLLAITGPNQDVQVWRVDGSLLYSLKETYYPVFPQDRRYLAVLSSSAALILHPRNGPQHKTLHLPESNAISRRTMFVPERCGHFISFSPGGEPLVAGGWSSRNDIQLWYTSTGVTYTKFVPPATFPVGAESHEHDEMVGLTFSSDGQRVLWATTFHTWSWDIATGNLTDKPPTDEMGNLLKKENGKISWDGESIAFESCGAIGCIFTGKSSGSRMTRLQVRGSLIWAWTLSPDGRVVATVTSETRGKIPTSWECSLWETSLETSSLDLFDLRIHCTRRLASSV